MIIDVVTNFQLPNVKYPSWDQFHQHFTTRDQFHQRVYTQLLCLQIPKAQKATWVDCLFYAFGIVKCWWNWPQVFCTKVFRAALLCLQLWFVFFYQKEIGAKVAHKMLVKLTTGINFTKKLVPRRKHWCMTEKVLFCVSTNCDEVS